MKYTFSISIVSHGHKKYLKDLLMDLAHLTRSDFEVILTLNIPEELPLDIEALPYKVSIINNDLSKGFAANHNAAFLLSQGDNFVILNPDIRLSMDPFEAIGLLLNTSPKVVCAPLVVNPEGKIEDSARNFPSPLFLLKKACAKILKISLKNPVMLSGGKLLKPDWVAGMFIVVPRSIYAQLDGLDERYHMYYEDVDFCARARMAGYEIIVVKEAQVMHEAQRDSHTKLRYLRWHVLSAIKFFTSIAYLKIRIHRLRRLWGYE